jgi:hypothetical protein
MFLRWIRALFEGIKEGYQDAMEAPDDYCPDCHHLITAHTGPIMHSVLAKPYYLNFPCDGGPVIESTTASGVVRRRNIQCGCKNNREQLDEWRAAKKIAKGLTNS